MKLTHTQKLHALAYRFYQGAAWTPKAGDFYTTSRADLELYQVVSVEGGIVRTRYTEGSDAISEWPEAGFLTEGFGPKRVFVPEWVINLKSACSELLEWKVTASSPRVAVADTPQGRYTIKSVLPGYMLHYPDASVERLPSITHAEHRAQSHYDRLAAALSAQPAVAVPDGWKLVPVGHTAAMHRAGSDALDTWEDIEKGAPGKLADVRASMCWAAMLAAAPQPTQPAAKHAPSIDMASPRMVDAVKSVFFLAADEENELLASLITKALGDKPYCWEAITGTAGAGEGCNAFFHMEQLAVEYVQRHSGYIKPLYAAPVTPPADQQENERLRQRVKALEEENERLKAEAEEMRARSETAEDELSAIAHHLDAEADSDSVLHIIREVQADLSIATERAAAAEARVKAREEERNRLRNKVAARALSDADLEAEIIAVDSVIDTGFGEGGGSPGEWWYERADELDHERKRRNLEALLRDQNSRAALKGGE